MHFTEIPAALLIASIIMVGLYLSNVAVDRGVPQYVSRKIGHLTGGMGLFMCLLFFQEPWWPLILTLGFAFLLGGARLIKPNAFRGVGGSGRSKAMAEVWFPLASSISILIGWVWLDNPALGIVPTLYLAWGDCITGLIRSHFYGREVKGIYGSYGMFVICVLIGLVLIEPWWVGLVGAAVVTLVEKFTVANQYVDDNLTVPVFGSIILALLLHIG